MPDPPANCEDSPEVEQSVPILPTEGEEDDAEAKDSVHSSPPAEGEDSPEVEPPQPRSHHEPDHESIESLCSNEW